MRARANRAVPDRRVQASPRFGLARVHGRSMVPTLADGDLLLVSYAAPVRPGALVVARLPGGRPFGVKRAASLAEGSLAEGRWWLTSDNPAEGTDSSAWGALAEHDLLGVVRLRVWPRPRLFRGPFRV